MSVQTTQAPRFQDLTELARTILADDAFFVAASVGIKNADPLDSTRPKTVVIKDDGTSGRKQLIEDRLRQRGIAVVVMPLQEGVSRDQSGPAWMVDSVLSVEVRINSDRNADTALGGAGVNIYEALSKIVAALTGSPRHPGGEFFKFVKYELVQLRDEGLWTYEIFFTKETVK